MGDVCCLEKIQMGGACKYSIPCVGFFCNSASAYDYLLELVDIHEKGYRERQNAEGLHLHTF